MSDLENMTDAQLAEWQAGWKEHSGKYILAEREWERRMISHEFSLQTKLAAANNRWLIAAAVIGLVGTVAGAIVGAYLTKAAQDNKSSISQQHTQLSPSQQKPTKAHDTPP